MTDQNQFNAVHWPIALVQGAHRVEMHLLPLADDRHVLVALAGAEQRPERIKGQGPFPHPDVATGVARRILESLLSDGYERAGEALWKLDAWRHRRGILEERARTPLRTEFHPDDVLD